MKKRKRYLLVTPNINGYYKGEWLVSYTLCKSGAIVIREGLDKGPNQIIESAIQEDVNVTFLPIYSEIYLRSIFRIVDLAKEHEIKTLMYLGNGSIVSQVGLDY